MRHRIVILGSLIQNVNLIKKAKERGYYTIVCDGYEEGPGKKIADKAYNIDIREIDAIVKMCIEEKVDGIIGSFSDIIFEQITYIADKVGLRWYVTPNNIKYYREKDKAKELLNKIGVSVPKYCVIDSKFEDSKLKDFKFPLVIKPTNGWGSRNIYVVNSIDDIRKKIKDSKLCKFVVEEYMNGREYNMMTWIIDGKINVMGIADREKNPQEGDKVPMLNRIVYPARKINNIIEKAKKILELFIRETKQKDGPLCMQFFCNENGIEVCEIAGRILGFQHDLIKMGSGLNIEDLLLDYVYNNQKEIRQSLELHNPNFNMCCAGLYFRGYDGKKIKNQEKIFEFQKDKHIIDMIPFYKNGEIIDNLDSRYSYYVVYNIMAESREELDKFTEYMFKEMYVEGFDGDNILYKLKLQKDN